MFATTPLKPHLCARRAKLPQALNEHEEGRHCCPILQMRRQRQRDGWELGSECQAFIRRPGDPSFPLPNTHVGTSRLPTASSQGCPSHGGDTALPFNGPADETSPCPPDNVFPCKSLK